MKRQLAVSLQVFFLFFAALTLLVGFSHFATSALIEFANETNTVSSQINSSTSTISDLDLMLEDGNSSILQLAPLYIQAIMAPEDRSFSRLYCPVPAGDRYDYLRTNFSAHTTNIHDAGVRRKYFFALDLHQCAGLLPRLLGSIVESMRFLGPEVCALSVVEGRSDDGTFEILNLLRNEIEGLGAKYFFTRNPIDPTAGDCVDRITALARLRNQAVQPLVDHPNQYSSNTTVLFINDISLCMEDILELVHQRVFQNADMTCAMDWTYVGADPTFYDVWVARGMNGESFFNITEDGSWDSAWNLFWDDPKARKNFYAAKPFQVFSCWDGATAFTAKPLLEQKIKFRIHYEEECYQGEPKLFCKDMWHSGYGKIAVVPSVNLEYTDEAAKKIKATKGYVSKWVKSEAEDRIEWNSTPPMLVKCMPAYARQVWVPWDEGLQYNDTAS